MTDSESTKFLTFDENQKSIEGATKLIETTIDSYHSDDPMMAFAIEDCTTNMFVGFCGLTPREDGLVEIMYAIMPDFRGNGYAVETASRLAQYAVSQLGYKRVIAPISNKHEASKAVATKAGFDDYGIRKGPDEFEKIRLYIYEHKDN